MRVVHLALIVLHMDNTAAVSQALAAIVRADIEASGKSLLHLSNLTGISRITLTRRVAGSPFIVTELLSLANALGLSVTDWISAAEQVDLESAL